MTKIFAVSGFKNSGKTTLCMKLLEELKKLGIRTGYIKRTSEEEETGRDTDTGKAAALGIQTALWSPSSVSVEKKGSCFTADEIAALYFQDAEIVLVEGGKYLDLPRIWVENGEKHDDIRGIFMTYDRNAAGGGPLAWSGGDEPEMANRLAATVRGKFYRSSSVVIGARPLPMKDFIADFVKGAVLGMLASLKGGKEPAGDIRIFIHIK